VAKKGLELMNIVSYWSRGLVSDIKIINNEIENTTWVTPSKILTIVKNISPK